MAALARVELQAEVRRPRAQLFELVSTSAGLRRWLDGAELDEASVGSTASFRMADAVANGAVLAADPPQHISYSWDWAAQSLGAASVVAFDLIDHGSRCHLTLRHVGLAPSQLEAHQALWDYWFRRLLDAADQPTDETADQPTDETADQPTDETADQPS